MGFLRSLKGEWVQFVDLSSNQSFSSLQSWFLLIFVFDFTPVQDRMLELVGEWAMLGKIPWGQCPFTIEHWPLRQSFLSLFPRWESCVHFHRSSCSFHDSIMAASSVLWNFLLLFHLFSLFKADGLAHYRHMLHFWQPLLFPPTFLRRTQLLYPIPVTRL